MNFIAVLLVYFSFSSIALGNGDCRIDLKVGKKTSESLTNCIAKGFLYPVGNVLTGKFIFNLRQLRGKDDDFNTELSYLFYKKRYASIDIYYFEPDTTIFEAWIQFNGIGKVIKGTGELDTVKNRAIFDIYFNLSTFRLYKKPLSLFDNTALLYLEVDIDAPTNSSSKLFEPSSG